MLRLNRLSIAFQTYRVQQRASYRFLHWPSSPKPTPYQIFGLENQVFDKKKLQDIYFELVKLYHPDRGATGNSERFKKVVEAHNILKDDMKRRSYDLTQQMSQSSDSPFYRKQHNSSTFNDDIDENYWFNQNQEAFDKGLHESRIWVLKFVSFLVVTFAILNFMFLHKAAEIRSEVLQAQTEKLATQLAQVREHCGTGNGAKERIDRFLNHRQRMIDKYDNEFSYEKLKSGNSRKKPNSDSTLTEQSKNDTASKEFDGMDTEPFVILEKPVSKGQGQRQSKENSGPVAEYFGRT